MPRDASGTRERLLREATRVFAERGVYQATLREITEAAGQRNSSALAYHFGSREGVLWAILDAHNGPVDDLRAAMLVEPIDAMATRDLIAALLVPYASELRSADGRDYLRIVAQLPELFPAWRGGPLSPPALRRILSILEARCAGDSVPARRQRVLHAVALISAAMAERARVTGAGGRHGLAEQPFLANLADMLSGGLAEPAGPLLG